MTLFVISTALVACADFGQMQKKRTLEQEAITTAVNLCKKFGHQPETKEFTACAEARFDEYVNHRR